MLVTNGLLYHRFEEDVREGVPRLGRHLALDARSLAYTIEAELGRDLSGVPIKPAAHPPAIPVLDQGHLGSCTGNAGTYALSVRPPPLAAIVLAGHRLSGDAILDEEFATELYHEATLRDTAPGAWPPTDTGSSGLAVCQALKATGLIGSYRWATTLRGVGVLLQRAGVLIGTPWYRAWFNPDADGFIDADPSWTSSGVAGGHEIYGAVLESWDDRDPAKSVLAFPNSWSESWGDHGYGRMRLSTYVLLKQQIDVKQLGEFRG